MGASLGATLGAALAIASCGGSDPEASDDEMSATESAPPLEAPEFLDPADGELAIRVDRIGDVVLGVQSIETGLTRVILDGHSLGGLAEPSAAGQLGGGELRLNMAGAMVSGNHTLKLRTQDSAEPLDSTEVLVALIPVMPPALQATLDSQVLFEADAIDAQGHGATGVLYGLDLQTDPPSLTAFRASGPGWNTDEAVTLGLPSFSVTDEAIHAVTATATVPGRTLDTPAEGRLRVAWRAGDEGEAVLAIDAAWPVRTPSIQTAVDLRGGWVGSAEYATLGRPVMLGDTLVVEALLATDVEQPHPGDRTLVTTRIEGEPGRFGPPQRSSVADGVDIDRIGPLRDLLTHRAGGVPGLSARIAGLRPVALELDAVTGALAQRPTGAGDRFSVLSDATGPLQMVLGALGSRQVFTPLGGPSPRVFLQQFSDRDDGVSNNAAPTADRLGDLDEPSGPATSTVVGGLAVFLIPQGASAPVVAVVAGGETPSVQRLEALRCDELAFPITDLANEDREVAVACRRGREVSLGTLAAPASDG